LEGIGYQYFMIVIGTSIQGVGSAKSKYQMAVGLTPRVQKANTIPEYE